MAGIVGAAMPTEAVPWTKSYLETRIVAQMERLSLATRGKSMAQASHHQIEGAIYGSSAPIEDWEFDAAVYGRSLPTSKFFVRAEKQLLSDLGSDPVALTVVADGSISGAQRSRSPVFFEMAKNSAEVGLGIGRHLLIRKGAYVQLFSYLMAGVGSSNARWASAEVGLQEVFSVRHYLRFSYSMMRAFGHSKRFAGIGTLNTTVDGVACSYAYRCDNGIEGRLSCLFRTVKRGPIRASAVWLLSVSLPISF